MKTLKKKSKIIQQLLLCGEKLAFGRDFFPLHRKKKLSYRKSEFVASMAHGSETVDLSDSEDDKVNDAGEGEHVVLDPRIILELEDEKNLIDTRLEKLAGMKNSLHVDFSNFLFKESTISEEISLLLQEQDALEQRRKEIGQSLNTITKSVSVTGKKYSSVDLWKTKFEWDENVERIRKDLFGILSFRQNQREVRCVD